MSTSDLLQVIALSSVLTLALVVFFKSFWRLLTALLRGCLRPRYLKSKGLRRRVSATTVKGESDEPA